MNHTPKVPEVVTQLERAILNNTPITDVISAELQYTLNGITLYPSYQDQMLLGPHGLPNTSRKLVEMGVFYIHGDYIALHPTLCQAFDTVKNKKDALLARLQRYHENQANGIQDNFSDAADFV